MSAKRKRIVLSLKTKLEALKRLDKGDSLKTIAFELGVGETTIHDWRKNREQLERFCTQITSQMPLSSRCTIKKSKLETIDDALWIWFSQERRRGNFISGPILKQKALALHRENGGNERFTASDGWLGRWKKRHGIDILTCKEKLSNKPTSDKFLEELYSIITLDNLSEEQIYNINEINFNYKTKKCKKIKVAECSNAIGDHKLSLFGIDESANPNKSRSFLPIYYLSENSTWIDYALLKEWFFKEFVPSVKKYLEVKNLPGKAVLFLCDIPSHSNCEQLVSSEIKIVFLPKSVASLYQNMLECLEKRDRRKFLSSILSKMEDKIQIESNSRQWLNCDDVLEIQLVDDTKIVQNATDKVEENKVTTIEHSVAKDALDLILSYVQQQPEVAEVTLHDVLTIKKWRDYAEKNEISDKKYKITDFCK